MLQHFIFSAYLITWFAKTLFLSQIVVRPRFKHGNLCVKPLSLIKFTRNY